EFAGNHRTWAEQVEKLQNDHRCITYSARGYPPSEIPERDEAYGQDIAVSDALAVLDALEIEQAHIVGHSMGAYTALHLGIRATNRCLSVAALGCGWGSHPGERDEARAMCEDIAEMFRTEPMDEAAAKYARFPMRHTFEAKNPEKFAAFEEILRGLSPTGAALTMLNLQRDRPTLWDMESQLKEFTPPLLVLLGDEDHPCLEGSLFLNRTVPTAALQVVPRAGHTITMEEPEIVNEALRQLFSSTSIRRKKWNCS
ncbi:MAG: alpha/beta hydrolase, partial [Rhodospirillales bacterium]|nr:alpha/beta hydrolase [Rhodospirillales bacterium]